MDEEASNCRGAGRFPERVSVSGSLMEVKDKKEEVYEPVKQGKRGRERERVCMQLICVHVHNLRVVVCVGYLNFPAVSAESTDLTSS